MYTNKTISVTNGIPAYFYDDQGKKVNIYIKAPEISDFNIKCTNKNIKLTTACRSDNFSGCNHAESQSKTFSTNGHVGALIIQDYAYNVRSYQYNIDHIDKIAPAITFKKGSQELNGNNYNFYASTDFYIDIKEHTTNSCLGEVNTSYILKINDKVVDAGISSNIDFKIDLGKYLQKKGVHKVELTAKDVYGNTSTKSVRFNIVPSMEGIENSALTILGADKIANNKDYYIYTIELKDKYGNNN